MTDERLMTLYERLSEQINPFEMLAGLDNVHSVSKKFTLFLFTITKSDVDQF